MSGMLIAEYILRERKATGTLPANGALVETIVTTDMAKAIAKAYGVKLIEVLTGFKYIGEQIKFLSSRIVMSTSLDWKKATDVWQVLMPGTRMPVWQS